MQSKLSRRLRQTLCALSLALTAGAAHAADYRVVVTGEVENNAFVSGTFAGIPAGAPVTMTIMLDSEDFLDSPSLPGITRGYRFTAPDFSINIGGVVTTLRASPAPNAYFVIRNNDPRVDGFFLSQGTDIDVSIPLQMTPNNFGVAFKRTFNGADTVPFPEPDPTLTSVDLAGAVGSWGFENLSVYNFNIELNENQTPLIMVYETITITQCAAVIAQPQDETICPDATAEFGISTEGSEPPTRSWSVIDPQTGATLTITNGLNTNGLGTPMFFAQGATTSQLSLSSPNGDGVWPIQTWTDAFFAAVTDTCGTVLSETASLVVLEASDLSCGAPCPGDHNGDQVVDLADLIAFNTEWQPNIGTSQPAGTNGDYNGDGMVDLADLIGFNTDWQPNIGVPCP